VGINSVVQETASDRSVPMVVKYLHVFWKSSCLFLADSGTNFRVTTCLENLKMTGNFTAVREVTQSEVSMGGKSCQENF